MTCLVCLRNFFFIDPNGFESRKGLFECVFIVDITEVALHLRYAINSDFHNYTR